MHKVNDDEPSADGPTAEQREQKSAHTGGVRVNTKSDFCTAVMLTVKKKSKDQAAAGRLLMHASLTDV